MLAREEELAEKLMREDQDFLKAKEAHTRLANEIVELEKKPFITPQDEIEIKVLKKRKLACKDQMERILLKYR